MKILDTPAAQRVINRINEWIYARSLDPVTPVLTETAEGRSCVQDLMGHFDEVEREVLAALPTATPIQGDMFFGTDITNDGLWDKIYLKWYNRPSARARELFPKTLEIIERHRDIHLAMVSILKPGARIWPHKGPWSGSIRVHIGVRTPQDLQCYIHVGGHRLVWMNGQMIAFDDTYIHEVRNKTDQPRIILFLDIERRMNGHIAQAIVRFLNLTVARLTTRE
jgi:hypothetical protein